MSIEDDFAGWYRLRRDHMARAQDDLVESTLRFVSDWSSVYDFRPPEHFHKGAVKEVERVLQKCQEKGILTDFDRLLSERPAHVGDLARTRMVFRSRSDVEAAITAIRDSWPLGDVDIEDCTNSPRPSGYRAVHVNGWLDAVVRTERLTIPYELQLKTVAQDAWGYYTHDSSYVPTEVNTHPRWGIVRGLQQVLSDQLHVVDILEQQIEITAEEVAHDVAQSAGPEEVMFSNVRQAMSDLYDVRCSISESQRLVRRAREIGITTMSDFGERINPDREASTDVVDSFIAARDRAPTFLELAAELLARDL